LLNNSYVYQLINGHKEDQINCGSLLSANEEVCKKLILTLELHDGGKQDFLDQGEVSSKHS
jgi:hypothetical protein